MAEPDDLARCDAEVAHIEALLRGGHLDVEGLLLALSDWSFEKRLIEAAIRCRESTK